MLIILGGVRCLAILKTGPPKGVPLEQLISEAFAEEFIKQTACFRVLGVLGEGQTSGGQLIYMWLIFGL